MLQEWIRRIYPGQPKLHEGVASHRLALDIGTEYAKAVYIQLGLTEAKVIGVGRARQDYADMESGAIASIPSVFAEIPQVTLLEPKHVQGIADPKGYLTGICDVTPKSMAYQTGLTYVGRSSVLGGARLG